MKTNVLDKLVNIKKRPYVDNIQDNNMDQPTKNLFIEVKEIVDENFQDYKKSSMMIASTMCDFKCFSKPENGPNLCHNMEIIKRPNLKVYIPNLFFRYMSNPITRAIVIGGLEPMLQFNELYTLIEFFRKNNCLDDIVIYTGYDKGEICNQINLLKKFNNIIVKYGRFIPNSHKRFDSVLGVYLNSNNQYAERIC